MQNTQCVLQPAYPVDKAYPYRFLTVDNAADIRSELVRLKHKFLIFSRFIFECAVTKEVILSWIFQK